MECSAVQQRMSFSLGKKMILLGIGISVVSIFITSFLSFTYAEEILKERINNQLISESQIRGKTIENLFETRIKETQILATDAMIQILVDDLNHPESISNEMRHRSSFLNEVKAFQELVGFSIGFEDVKIIGRDGTVFFFTQYNKK